MHFWVRYESTDTKLYIVFNSVRLYEKAFNGNLRVGRGGIDEERARTSLRTVGDLLGDFVDMEHTDCAGDDRGSRGLLGGVLRTLARPRSRFLSVDWAAGRGAMGEGNTGSGDFVAAGERAVEREHVWTCGLDGWPMGIVLCYVVATKFRVVCVSKLKPQR